jgi:hypothetical protein
MWRVQNGERSKIAYGMDQRNEWKLSFKPTVPTAIDRHNCVSQIRALWLVVWNNLPHGSSVSFASKQEAQVLCHLVTLHDSPVSIRLQKALVARIILEVCGLDWYSTRSHLYSPNCIFGDVTTDPRIILNEIFITMTHTFVFLIKFQTNRHQVELLTHYYYYYYYYYYIFQTSPAYFGPRIIFKGFSNTKCWGLHFNLCIQRIVFSKSP